MPVRCGAGHPSAPEASPSPDSLNPAACSGPSFQCMGPPRPLLGGPRVKVQRGHGAAPLRWRARLPWRRAGPPVRIARPPRPGPGVAWSARAPAAPPRPRPAAAPAPAAPHPTPPAPARARLWARHQPSSMRRCQVRTLRLVSTAAVFRLMQGAGYGHAPILWGVPHGSCRAKFATKSVQVSLDGGDVTLRVYVLRRQGAAFCRFCAVFRLARRLRRLLRPGLVPVFSE